MRILYTLIVEIARVVLPLIGLLNPKLNSFLKERRSTFVDLEKWRKSKSGRPVLWLHCSSLGEYEMIVPIISEQSTQREFEVVVSFFSSSGYNHAKTNDLVDLKFYLPLDRQSTMKKLVKTLDPSVFVLVKYDFWLNLLNAVNNHSKATILVNGLFGDKQFITKTIAQSWRKQLKRFDCLFVQNKASEQTLKRFGFNNVVLSKDLRYDRVVQLKKQNQSIKAIEEFVNNQPTLILGSSWPAEEYIALQYLISSQTHVKLIIAPHDVSAEHIEKLQEQFKQFSTVLLTEAANFADARVLVINSIGQLSSAYQYATYAFIGGAFGKGLHNVLEAAVYGLPIFTGPNIARFPEAVQLQKMGALQTVDQDPRHFIELFSALEQHPEKTGKVKQDLKLFIEDQLGESTRIAAYIQSKA